MAYSRYPYRAQGLESQGFYNPNMASPDWSQGIGFFLNQLVQRKDQKTADEEDTRRWEEEQQLEKDRQGIWEQQIAAQMEPGDPPGAGNIAILKERYDQLIGQGHPPKQASEWVYGPGREPQPRTGTADTTMAKHLTSVQNFAKDTRKRYEDELKRLVDRADAMTEGGGDPAALAETINNLKRVIDYIAQLEAEIRQSNQVTGNQMNTLRDLAGGMHKMKEGYLPSQQQPGPGGMPGPGAGAPQGGVPEAPQQPMDIQGMVAAMGLPPEEAARLLKTIEELGLSPEQAQQALEMLYRSMQGQQEIK